MIFQMKRDLIREPGILTSFIQLPCPVVDKMLIILLGRIQLLIQKPGLLKQCRKMVVVKKNKTVRFCETAVKVRLANCFFLVP